MVEEKKKKYELTKEGKIVIIVGVTVLGLLIAIYLILFNKDKLERLTLNLLQKDDVIFVDDPILGKSVKLDVNKKLYVDILEYPEKHKYEKINVIIDDEGILEYNKKDNSFKALKEGNTKIHVENKSGKIKSEEVSITVE